MMDDILRADEKASLALRQLYRGFGYTPYRMSKFEEYEYYIRNKDFLVSDRIITFTDTNGRLLALKPDVTLSIIKNTPIDGGIHRVCYNEGIYRPDSAGQYRELMQTGLECIGALSTYDLYEVLLLAARSLDLMGKDNVIQLSHMGILTAAVAAACPDEGFAQEATGYIASKNSHDLLRLCDAYGVDSEKTNILTSLASIRGSRAQVLGQLEQLAIPGAEEALAQLRAISALLDETEEGQRILLDFSVVNDMNYYSGIVFRGFLSGISDGILAGGQYDKLMKKLGRSAGAIGFAVYLDLLEQLPQNNRPYDVDVLVLTQGAAPETVARTVRELTNQGLRVSVQREIPAGLRYGKILECKEDAPC